MLTEVALSAHPSDALSLFLWNLGYAMCHQLPARSYFYGGYQMPVCARDMGIYLGFLVAFSYWMLRGRWRAHLRPDWIVFGAAIAGVLAYAADALSSYLGLRDTSNALRLASGLLMGASIAILLLSALSALHGTEGARRSFSWKDLPAIYLAILLIGIVAAGYDLGPGMYYFMETVSMAGLLLLLMTAFMVVVSALRPYRLSVRKDLARMLAISALATAVLLVALWFFHDIVYAYLPAGALG